MCRGIGVLYRCGTGREGRVVRPAVALILLAADVWLLTRVHRHWGRA